MKVLALKSRMVEVKDDLFSVVEEGIAKNLGAKVPERSVFLISSKIVSYCQGRLLFQPEKFSIKKEKRAEGSFKHQLVMQEADWYLPALYSKYNMMLAIKEGTLTVNAGIDESNASIKDANAQERAAVVLWPENMQKVANQLWEFLRERYGVKEVGVIITDSRSFPLRWGVVGMALVSSGFYALNSRIGDKDLFQREIKMVQVNVAEALAVAATFLMGEVDEQSPMALISNLPQLVFRDQFPSQAEIEALRIDKEDDIYGPLLKGVKWQKGGGGIPSKQIIQGKWILEEKEKEIK